MQRKLLDAEQSCIDILDTWAAQHGIHTAPIDTVPTDPCEYAQDTPLRFSATPFTFTGREWLYDIMRDPADTVCIAKPRQCGWSVMLAFMVVWYARRYPGIHVMYCTMRQEQFRFFSRQRLRPLIRDMGATTKSDENRIRSIELTNGSLITLVSGHDEFSQALGYPVDILMLDEAEKLPLDSLAVIRRTLAASKHGKMYIGGTGGLQGQPWPAYKKQAGLRTYSIPDKQWSDTPPHAAVDISGYQITPQMVPGWTAEKQEAARTEPGMTPARYETEVLGIDTTLEGTPLPEYAVRACMLPADWTAWQDPASYTRPSANHIIITSVDLAQGGNASDTVCATYEYNISTRIMRLLHAIRTNEMTEPAIYAAISPHIDQWRPDHIICDAGGNEPLRDHLMQSYNCIPRYMAAPKDQVIIYKKEGIDVISHSAFCAMHIARYREKRISLPDTQEPWVIEQLTSITQAESTSRTGTSAINYQKISGKKNDLLMTGVLTEAHCYSLYDENNPRNVVFYGGAA